MPSDKPHELQTDLPDPTLVAHAGKIDDPTIVERGVKEFDNTTLRGAVAEGLVDPASPPDSVAHLLEDQDLAAPPTPVPAEHESTTSKKVRKVPLWAKIATPITAAAALGGGLMALSGSDKAEKKGASSEPSEQIVDEQRGEGVETPIEKAKSYGNIDLASIDLGTNPITAVRPNGEQIRVPSLDNSSPQRLGLTALDLLACYMTTGDDKCLSGFSKNPDVQRALIEWRQKDIVPMLSDTRYPENKDFQVAVFDDPNDPAIFTATPLDNDRQVIELSGGTVYYGRHLNPSGPNEWQGEETRRAGVLEQQIYKLRLFVLGSGTNVTIDGLEQVFRQPMG